MALEMETWQIPTQVEIKPDTKTTIKTFREIQEITPVTLLETLHTIGRAIQVDGDILHFIILLIFLLLKVM